MMAVLGVLVFAGAFAVSAGVIVHAVAPEWRRILRLAAGQVEPSFAPLTRLAVAERRIAVRRWAALPVSPHLPPLREVA